MGVICPNTIHFYFKGLVFTIFRVENFGISSIQKKIVIFSKVFINIVVVCFYMLKLRFKALVTITKTNFWITFK
jgi:hypothetical protein